ncbi:MAG: Crp/Fnr family transcriptional regulator [Nitrospirales bacterium]|nr:MAG: Crp/Fnr family transcriptional regulator [Nitrospirales bacterium]
MPVTDERFQAKKLWYLKKIKVFAELSWQERQELHRTAHVTSYRKGELIALSGDPMEHVYLLKEGQVKISKMNRDGRESMVAVLGSGEIFGELEGFGTALHASMVEAVEPVTICEIQRKKFDTYMEAYPETGGKTLKFMGGRLQQIETRASSLVFKSASARLASLLLELSEKMGDVERSVTQSPIRFSHQNLANLIGVSVETVNTLIGQFAQHGLLERDRRSIRLLDKTKLANVR